MDRRGGERRQRQGGEDGGGTHLGRVKGCDKVLSGDMKSDIAGAVDYLRRSKTLRNEETIILL